MIEFARCIVLQKCFLANIKMLLFQQLWFEAIFWINFVRGHIVPPSLRSNLAYTAKYVLYKLTYTVITVTKIPDHTPRLQKTSYTRKGQLIAGMILNVIDASARILAKDWKTLISGHHFPVTFPETKCSTLPSRAERNKNDLSDDIVLMSLGYRPDFCKYFGEIAPLIIKVKGY